MAGSLNKVLLIGNAGKECEIRYSASGVAQGTFSLAVNSRKKIQDGSWADETEWFNIVIWDKLAENVGQHIQKGKSLYVEGRLQTRSWDKDGVRQYRTEVIANSIQLLGSKDDGQRSKSDPDDAPWE